MPPSTPELAPLLDTYFSNKISLYHKDRIQDAAEQLTANGTPAFNEGIGLQVVGVPVASNHTRFIGRSLVCLAQQAKYAPTMPAVVMSLNHPEYDWGSRRQVAENAQLVKRFQKEHPQLAVSFFETSYEDGVSIGEVRDGMFGAAAILHEQRARAERRPLSDLIFTNWDVDTLRATPHYFAQAQHSFGRHMHPIWTAHPNTQHARVAPAELPSANRLVAWYDLGVRAAAAALPAHYSINMYGWLLGKGYMHGEYGEHAALRQRLKGLRNEEAPISYLATATAAVSPHRFMGKMAAGESIGYDSLTVPARAADVQPLTFDISSDYFNRELEWRLRQVISAAYQRRDNALKGMPGIQAAEAAEMARQYARRYVRAAAAIIGNIHDTDTIIEAQFKPRQA